MILLIISVGPKLVRSVAPMFIYDRLFDYLLCNSAQSQNWNACKWMTSKRLKLWIICSLCNWKKRKRWCFEIHPCHTYFQLYFVCSATAYNYPIPTTYNTDFVCLDTKYRKETEKPKFSCSSSLSLCFVFVF